ncbi:MAG TPA: peptidylprolyl isomerase [Parvularculaceae bacterium]|nr:peptidylprolyl isomerase [Parvularculaceae bacterium]
MKPNIGVAALAAAFLAVPAVAKDKNDKTAVVRPIDIASAAPDDAWRPIDLENTLLMDLPQGEVVIEMRPDIAPKTVAQIKTLVRQHFYDDLDFHRVIEGFVAQGGDPKGDGTGGSSLPDIPAEFTHDTEEMPDFTPIGRDRMAARVGFIDGLPAAAQPESLRSFRTDKHVEVWGAHCPGVMSMARTTDPNSANSQFFLVIGDARQSLDRRYAVWGWIVAGFENTRRIERGEPPKRPTPILRMRIAADVPDAEKPHILVMKTDSEAFQKYLEAAGVVKDGFVRNLCAIETPRKINGKVEL